MGATTVWAVREPWNLEYGDKPVIPSSHRVAPSKALSCLTKNLRIGHSASVLDAGCGTGRHALHFAAQGATVHAVDISSAAVETVSRRLRSEIAIRARVSLQQAELSATDLPDSTYDLVIDSYASCHIKSDVERLEYLQSLTRCIRPGGYLYTSAIGIHDTYYAQGEARSGEEISWVEDPVNNMGKVAFSQTALTEYLSGLGQVTSKELFFPESVESILNLRHVVAGLVRVS